MPLDYVELIEELNSRQVHIKDKAKVNSALRSIIADGKDNVQLLSDFDGTITKSCEICYSSTYGKNDYFLNEFSARVALALIKRCPSLSQKYLTSSREIEKKYDYADHNSNTSYEEKVLLLTSIWKKLMECLEGEAVSFEEFTKTVIQNKPSLREGAIHLLGVLSKANVPVLLCTAGFANTVEVVLKHFGVLSSNIKVAGNFLSFSNGVIQPLTNSVAVTTISKNNLVANIIENVEFLNHRDNFIVLGDAVGDANMADGIQHAKHILKIGFRCSDNYYTVAEFLDVFDIVVEDGSSVNVVQAIFNRILE